MGEIWEIWRKELGMMWSKYIYPCMEYSNNTFKILYIFLEDFFVHFTGQKNSYP